MFRAIELTDKLLDRIYDAATEQDLWRSVLTEIADLTNSQGGILFGQSFGARKVYFDYNGRLDKDCNRAYEERHMQNAWSEAMETQPVGRVVFSDETVPLASLRPTLLTSAVAPDRARSATTSEASSSVSSPTCVGPFSLDFESTVIGPCSTPPLMCWIGSPSGSFCSTAVHGSST